MGVGWTKEDYAMYKRECERIADAYGWLDIGTVERWAAGIVEQHKQK